MTTLRRITLTCPVCKHRVESLAVTSTNALGRRTTDFLQYAAGTQPLLYQVHACLKCGFSGYPSTFNEPVGWSMKRFVRKQIKPLLPSDSLPAARKYEYAARISERSKAGPREIADLYLRAAWCCVLEGELTSGDEQKYRRRSINYFELEVETNPAADASIIYMIGEQYRRIGQSDDARRWYDRTIAAAAGRKDESFWVELSRQQQTNPRETFDCALRPGK